MLGLIRFMETLLETWILHSKCVLGPQTIHLMLFMVSRLRPSGLVSLVFGTNFLQSVA